ncbi:hypothetical protein CG717_16370 [Streptomyces sp. CB02613]|uniref:hypothetical protein n=1 Tax=Streptomyces sp. CB02613 TaxID=2020328 RepID=UPI000C2784C9|nr:hypothetical protein [Streptomyces sp. CB02613]PJN31338.1 hypothetical protein CG717_16370 [Streptomyces sp. CB02613]
MRSPTDARLAVLRELARDHVGDITTRMVQQLYVSKFGPGDWHDKARQDLAQLTGEGLLICDDTDPGRRVHRFNHAKGGHVHG